MSFFRFSTFREAAFVLMRPNLWFRQPLKVSSMDVDPYSQFIKWYESAHGNIFIEFPNAMTLCTCGEDGAPDGRIVLLKGIDKKGFVFYTNTESAKGKELSVNQSAALVFYWAWQQRQVRVRGKCELVSNSEADRYFASRPYKSKIGAWASLQSRVMSVVEKNENKGLREPLDSRVTEFINKFPNDVPRPEYWTGYRLVPESFEFWQLRLSRLHDRFFYNRNDSGGWTISLLYP